MICTDSFRLKQEMDFLIFESSSFTNILFHLTVIHFEREFNCEEDFLTKNGKSFKNIVSDWRELKKLGV